MDFDKILRDAVGSSDANGHRAIIESLRQKLAEKLSAAGHPPTSDIARLYSEKLESAVARLNAESTRLKESQMNQPHPQNAINRPLGTGEAASTDHASSGFGFTSLAAALAVGAILGFGISSFLAPSAPAAPAAVAPVAASPMTKHMEQFAPLFGANSTYLKTVETALNNYQRQTGNYPVNQNFEPVYNKLKDLPQLSGQIAPQGVSNDNFYYRGDGKDFKLLFIKSGDCFIARSRNPELVDPYRASGPVDCEHYGVWTSGAKNF